MDVSSDTAICEGGHDSRCVFIKTGASVQSIFHLRRRRGVESNPSDNYIRVGSLNKKKKTYSQNNFLKLLRNVNVLKTPSWYLLTKYEPAGGLF